MSEWLEYEVTWTEEDGGTNTYQANGRDLAAERDALLRARAVLQREAPPTDVVIQHRTVVSQTGPWISQAVDLSVVVPALDRVRATRTITPSSAETGPPIRTMRDGSQEYGPYLHELGEREVSP